MQTRTAVPRPFAHPPVSRLAAAAALLLTLQACADGAPTAPEPESPRLSHQGAAHVVINEIMADPNRVTDADGEWFELYNWGAAAIDVGGWIIASNDGSHTIAGSLVVPAGGYVVLGRNGSTKKNGGVSLSYVYGGAITLANAADWLALRDATGASVDSVVWTSTTAGTARGVRDAGAANLDAQGPNDVVLGPPSMRTTLPPFSM